MGNAPLDAADEASDEAAQFFWGKTYLIATSIGLLVAAAGLFASYRVNVFSNRVSAFQKVQIAQANERAAALERDAETAKAQIAAANAEAARANERAAILMKGVVWRSLDSGEQAEIAAILPNTNKPVHIGYPSTDPEAAMLAGDIAGAFSKAGWRPTLEPFIDSMVWMLVNVFRTPDRDEEAVARAFAAVRWKGIELGVGATRVWGRLGPQDAPDFQVRQEVGPELRIIVGGKLRYLPQYNPAFRNSDPAQEK
jgi:outer membrane murein-binding lipoprotein Lpp